MKALYLNDNSCLPHVGCKGVHDAHLRLFELCGIEVVWSFFKNDLWAYKKFTLEEAATAILNDLGKLIETVDIVVVNGEGTLHHGKGNDLIAFIKTAKALGKSVYLINALIEEVDAYADVLASCDGIMVRDVLSLELATRYNGRVQIAPDSIVYARFDKVSEEFEAAGKVVFTDCLSGEKGIQWKLISDLIQRYDDDALYFPLENEFFSGVWSRALEYLKSARCIVTGRHHGCYLAMMLGKPFVLLDSNSHKIKAIRAQYGDFIEICEQVDEIEAAIERAVINKGKFQAVGEALKGFDFEAAYASFFDAGRRKRSWFSRLLKSKKAFDWTSYATRLLGLNSQDDPRALTLKHFLRQFAGASEKHSGFWKRYFALVSKKPFLLDMLLECASGVMGSQCRTSVEKALAQQGRELNTLDYIVVQDAKSLLGKDLRKMIAQGRRMETGYYFYQNPRLAVDQFSVEFYRQRRYSDVIALGDFHDFSGRPRVLFQYGNSCYKSGCFEKSLRAFGRVDDPDLYIQRNRMIGQITLQKTNHRDGWVEFNRVIENSDYSSLRDSFSGFTGIVPGARSVLIVFNPCEGIGGQLMFSRVLDYYLEINDFHKVGLVIERRLSRLIQKRYPDVCVYELESEALQDQCAGYESICFVREILAEALRYDYERTIQHIASSPPFLVTQAPVSGAVKKVAFSWTTTNASSVDYRSIPAGSFAGTLAELDVDCYPLQHGCVTEDLAVFRGVLGDRLKMPTIEPSAPVEDLLQFLGEMDMVITIDNSLLHMAGSINKPCIGLLSVPCYWQWPKSGVESFWYPSVRIIRQEVPGYWGDALEGLINYFKRGGVPK